MSVHEPGLDQLRRELIEAIQAVDASIRQRVDGLEASVRQDIASVESRLHDRMDGIAAETRRHFDVAAESLRSDIVLVAEGLTALDEKMERFRGEVREEFVRVDRRLLHLEVRVSSAFEDR
jgi:hypothetical protein